MKTLTANASTKSQTKLATEPLVVLKAEWGGSLGTRWYADKKITIGTIAAEGRILQMSSLAWSTKQDNVGSFGSTSVELEDSDGSLKAAYDAAVLEGTVCGVYQHWVGNNESDMVLLFKGVIVGPIKWSEGERKLSFDVESKVQDKQLGFEPPPDKYLTDEAWPLSYGNVVHSKALLITKRPSAVLKTKFEKGNTSFDVVDSSEFVQGQFYKLEIDGYIFSGTFTNNTFHVSEANLPKYQNLPFGTRDATDPTADFNAAVAWLQDFKPIVNNYVYIQDEFNTAFVLRVIRQQGKKVFFDSIYAKGSGQVAFLGPGAKILQVAKHGREGWEFRIRANSLPYTVGSLSGPSWRIMPGTAVKEWDPDKPDVYVCNIIPSNAIVSVWGEKDGVFKNIPSFYYSKSLDNVIEGQHATTLTFALPLTEAGWSSDVWVTMRSSQGPNVIDVLKHIVETWTGFTVDSTTYTSVKAKVVNYPVGFTLYSREDALAAIEQIAWLARIGLTIEGGVVKFVYLSEEPASSLTITEAIIKLKSIEQSATLIEDMATRFVATWNKDGHAAKVKRYVREENISRFGLHERTFNFYIYNIESLVKKSADFWSKRMSKPWKLARFACPMKAIGVEMFDGVTLGLSDTAIFGIPSLKAVVRGHEYDSAHESRGVALDLWLPVQVGTAAVDPDAWMSDVGDTMPTDPTTAYGETTDDDLKGDDASRAFAGAADNSQDLAIVVQDVRNQNFAGDYLVDVYADGYDHPATATNVLVYLLDPSKNLPTAAFSIPATWTIDGDGKTVEVTSYNADRTLGDKVTVIYKDLVKIMPDNERVRSLGRVKYIENGSSQVQVAPGKARSDSASPFFADYYPDGLNSTPSIQNMRVENVDPTATTKKDDVGLIVKSKDKAFFIPTGAPSNKNGKFTINQSLSQFSTRLTLSASFTTQDVSLDGSGYVKIPEDGRWIIGVSLEFSTGNSGDATNRVTYQMRKNNANVLETVRTGNVAAGVLSLAYLDRTHMLDLEEDDLLDFFIFCTNSVSNPGAVGNIWLLKIA